MSGDPRRDPSWKPKMQGVRLPAPGLLPKIIESLPPSVRHPSKASTGVKAGVGSALVLSLAAILWQGLPPVIEALKSEPEPEPVEQQCATQAALDDLSARVIRLEQRAEYDFQFSCALNAGNPGPGAECVQGYFFPNREPPPIYRTDRIRK